jgi:diketogulonate reductase-like aldo/keto reductase
LGTWHYQAGPEPLRKGLDSGALFIDTAESYGTEPIVSQAIAGRREHVFLATKVSPRHFRRNDVLAAADKSLKQLRTSYIDLYQLHEPNARIPIEETLAAMEELVQAGKVRFVGVSNFTIAQLKRAKTVMRKHSVVSNQVRFNLIDRTIERGLLGYCQQNHVTVIAYSPLGRRYQNITDSDPKRVLASISKAIGRTPAQIVLNWCLCREGVVVIPKSNSIEHVTENCGASDWRLNLHHLQELDRSIIFRRRGTLENFLRRVFPTKAKQTFLNLLARFPGSWRRRIN